LAFAVFKGYSDPVEYKTVRYLLVPTKYTGLQHLRSCFFWVCENASWPELSYMAANAPFSEVYSFTVLSGEETGKKNVD
jgi:hypothetical protein